MEIKQEIYHFFANYIFKHLGVLYEEKDFYRLDNRLRTLKEGLGLESIEELYKEFRSKVTLQMHEMVIKVATNNETYFFRDVKPFKAMTEIVIPEILKTKTYKDLSIWSVACSSGQEACSIAMSVAQEYPDLYKTLKIDACDISLSVIEKAKSGIYSELEVLRGTSKETVDRFFSSTGTKGEMKVNKEILDKISYSTFNLIDGVFPTAKYDMIFCRNVLIYHNKDNREIILNNLSRSLKENGVLVMGSGESLIGLDVELEQQMFGNVMFFIKKQSQLKSVA